MPISIAEVIGDLWPDMVIVDVGAMDIPKDQVPYGPLLEPGRFSVFGFEAVQAECDRLNAMGRPGSTVSALHHRRRNAPQVHSNQLLNDQQSVSTQYKTP